MELFTKQNNSLFKDQLFCEAQGLSELKKYSTSIMIPEVKEVGEDYLKIEKIASRPFDSAGFEKLGMGLAQIHIQTAESFGLSSDNYIGLNPQNNEESKNWGEFFRTRRLQFQAKLIKNPALRDDLLMLLEDKKEELEQFLNDHRPAASPVHGDLWSGNVLYDGTSPWLIDPAFYFGDREVDIAMAKMFGGFGREFYQSYEREFPLPEGHGKRTILYNFYHYLNHYNLFGSSYLTGVKTGIDLIERL